jgi:hypothetical protein
MQLNLDSFNNDKPTKERVNETIASGIQLKGVEKIEGLSEILSDIFQYYELEKGILKLRDESCSSCKNKLKRKGIYNKEISLPGGVTFLLKFHQYSCPSCKNKVDRRLGIWFTKGERYSSNVKSDAIRLYLNHLSSYESVHKELKYMYQFDHLSKRTVIQWLKKVGVKASCILLNQKDFSGHFIYDEEYLKVYEGDVGKKNAKLQRIEVYLLLFRDAITGNVVLMMSDSLDKSVLIKHWKAFAEWSIDNNIPWRTLTTDGKREFDTMVKELNRDYKLFVKHAYCIFHFKKNLYEVCNKYLFGVTQTKKELPEHIKNQITEIEKCIDLSSMSDFRNGLVKLKYQILTFISPLQDQIKRLRKYELNYALHKEYPFLRTTNACEHWFGQTKPEKIKQGYKTRDGILQIAQALAIKITYDNWKSVLEIPKDIKDATELLISSLIYKQGLIRPA